MATIDFSKLITSDQKTSVKRDEALARLADLRWQYETGGVIFAKGQMVSTSRESQAQIINLVQSLEAGLTEAPVLWKLQDKWVELSAGQINTMAKAVSAHVRHSFGAEKIVSDLVVAAKVPSKIDLAEKFETAYHSFES